MPPLKRRGVARREKFIELTDEIRRVLHNGMCFFEEPGIEVLRDAWEQYGEEITEKWIDEKPCSRPFGAWLFDIVPEYGERLTTPAWDKCAPYRDNWLKHGILHTSAIPSMQEREATFLERHDLLTPEEVLHLIDNPELRELKAFPPRDEATP